MQSDRLFFRRFTCEVLSLFAAENALSLYNLSGGGDADGLLTLLTQPPSVDTENVESLVTHTAGITFAWLGVTLFTERKGPLYPYHSVGEAYDITLNQILGLSNLVLVTNFVVSFLENTSVPLDSIMSELFLSFVTLLIYRVFDYKYSRVSW